MPKTAFVTIAGRTNAGKSSLLNAIVGEKIASVTSKPQTTRTRITGIRNIDDVQLVFFDTPGLHKPVNKLSEHMLNTVRESVSDIDAVIFMVDCTKRINEQEMELLRSMNASKMPVILVLNKIDLLKSMDELAPVIQQMTSQIDFKAVIPVSVTQNNGVDIVIKRDHGSCTGIRTLFPRRDDNGSARKGSGGGDDTRKAAHAVKGRSSARNSCRCGADV